MKTLLAGLALLGVARALGQNDDDIEIGRGLPGETMIASDTHSAIVKKHHGRWSIVDPMTDRVVTTRGSKNEALDRAKELVRAGGIGKHGPNADL